MLVVLAVVGALVLRPGGPFADPAPSSSVARPTPDSPTRPAPSAAPQSPSLSPSTSPSPTEPCPVGSPFSRQEHPRDGRVHGGGLSFPRQPGWEEPGPQASAFTWAYDLGETDLQVEPQWYAAYAIGAVAMVDGFEDPQTAAELALRCSTESSLYRNVTSRTDLVNEETTLDGYRAWTIRTEIRAEDERTTAAGDTIQITVVDLDSPESLSFFWGSAPIGDTTFTAQLDEVVDQLRVG